MKIRKRKQLLVVLFLLLFSCAVFFLEYRRRRKKICFEKHCFFVETAETERERAKGLMFRKYMGPRQGMLFVFEEEGVYPFWMKNTEMSLDIIWLDREKRVVFMEKEARPCTDSCPLINPGEKAKYVLEIKAGVSDRIGVEKGDLFSF